MSDTKLDAIGVKIQSAHTPKRENKSFKRANSCGYSLANDRRSMHSTHGASSVGGGGSLYQQLQQLPAGTSAKRLYRAGENKWVTRDIASLDFLLGIPLGAEQTIVAQGWQQQLQREHDEDFSQSEEMEDRILEDVSPSAKGTWWEKWIKPDVKQHYSPKKSNSKTTEADELERPTEADSSATFGDRALTDNMHSYIPTASAVAALAYTPGRRLEGDEAVRIQIPLKVDTVTKQRSIARLAGLREWELQTAHGLGPNNPPMLDGRLFFSANSSYPVSVFSIIRYEPKKEEAAIRRRKLEAIGGGGSQFVLPARDWRGVSYRALLRRTGDDQNDKKAFNIFVSDRDCYSSDESGENVSSSSSTSSDESGDYVPGVLDDPGMSLGRHRTVMIGDRVTGPIVSSTIQFVEPTLLKAELNKQFRELFDGWEPPKSARKYIGAKVIQGKYVLMDPADDHDELSFERRRIRQGSIASVSSAGEKPQEKSIRMPPSLTLSKIRSLKRQALHAAVKAKLQIGTVALSCVYFERLCLDCRVDKSNRRLTFAACLLLASKLNEPNMGLVTEELNDNDDVELRSMLRPNKRSNKMFESLLLFFTQEWSLSLKHIFTAEWGVFAALGFSLHASPSQVSFHFKRLLKTLEWNPLDYLGSIMYTQWQEALAEEEERRTRHERKKEIRRKQKEERLLNLHIEMENEVLRRKNDRQNQESPTKSSVDTELTKPKIGTERRMKLFNRFGLRRSASHERIHHPDNHSLTASVNEPVTRRRSGGGLSLPLSPSMPTLATLYLDTGIVAIDISSDGAKSDASSIGLPTDDGIVF